MAAPVSNSAAQNGAAAPVQRRFGDELVNGVRKAVQMETRLRPVSAPAARPTRHEIVIYRDDQPQTEPSSPEPTVRPLVAPNAPLRPLRPAEQ
jgi:hypothetical protein